MGGRLSQFARTDTRGVVAMSAGNHPQAVARHARSRTARFLAQALQG